MGDNVGEVAGIKASPPPIKKKYDKKVVSSPRSVDPPPPNAPLDVRAAEKAATALTLSNATDAMRRILNRPEVNMLTPQNIYKLRVTEYAFNRHGKGRLPEGFIQNYGDVISWNLVDSKEGDSFVEFLEQIGRGSYGIIYKGEKSGKIYKKILPVEEANAANKNYENAYREAFVQTVLGNDPVVGDKICKIEKMYRSPLGGEKNTYFYVMEDAGVSMRNYLRNRPTLDELRSIMTQLADLLKYLYYTYNFRHNDLHDSNLMVKKDADGSLKIKLIDFGKARIIIERTLYADGYHVSYDLLILLTSIYQLSMQYLSPECKAAIEACFTDSKGFNIFEEVVKQHQLLKEKPPECKGRTKYIYHYMYNEKIVNRGRYPCSPWGKHMQMDKHYMKSL